MRDLNFQLKWLCRHNRDGSYQTQANREKMLILIADQLHDLGYRQMTTKSLKPKHIDALVERWHSEKITIGTIKNRMAVLRWWAAKVNKSAVVASSNAYYGIADRTFVTNHSKAKSLTPGVLETIPDASIRLSLELQQAFGLRREEALKFSPSYADRGDKICLKPSWTKGGKARDVPIRTEAQRDLLNRAHRAAGRGSLIPADRSYIQQLRIYERHTLRAGMSKLHGLRHHYAQRRYQDLTGWKSPAAGGLAAKLLNPEQRIADQNARATISEELGHTRLQIVAVYLGR